MRADLSPFRPPTSGRRPLGQQRRRLALKLLAIVAGVAIFGLTFRTVRLHEVAQLLSSAGPLLLVVVVPFAFAMALDTIAWQGMFEKLGRSLPFRRLYALRVSSEAVLMSLSGGAVLSEGIAPVILKRHFGIPMSESVATGFTRRLLIAVAQAFYLGLGAILGYAVVRDATQRLVGQNAIVGDATQQLAGQDAVALLLIGLAVCMLVASGTVLYLGLRGQLSRRLGAGVCHLLSRTKFSSAAAWCDRIERFATSTDRHLEATVASGRAVVPPLLLFFVAWLAEALETFLILRLLGIEVSFFAVWAFEPLISLVRHALFFLPAGLGVQELGYVTFLRALGVADPLGVGAAFAVVKRAKEGFFIALGLMLLAVGPTQAAAKEAV